MLKTYEDAIETSIQHSKPCSDCPFRRNSLPGWLGNMTVEEWVGCAHGESRMECHTLIPQQCAGAAIYRSNVLKRPRDRELLRLPADREKVFASAREFTKHHDKESK